VDLGLLKVVEDGDQSQFVQHLNAIKLIDESCLSDFIEAILERGVCLFLEGLAAFMLLDCDLEDLEEGERLLDEVGGVSWHLPDFALQVLLGL